MEALPPEINKLCLETPALSCNRFFVHTYPDGTVRITFGEQIFSDTLPSMRFSVKLSGADAMELTRMIPTLLQSATALASQANDPKSVN